MNIKANDMNLYTLTSDLHGELSMAARHEKFIQEIEQVLGTPFCYKDGEFADYGEGDDVIYVRTGGTEGIFKSIFCPEGELNIPGGKKVRLLTSGKSNSLAASMEILSYLVQKGYPGEIIHGTAEQIVAKLNGACAEEPVKFRRPLAGNKVLEGKKLGVVGRPSDWLISSDVDYVKAKEVLGVELIDIEMDELVAEFKSGVMEEVPALKELNAPKYGNVLDDAAMNKALLIYSGLKRIIKKYSLDGLTLRCFDLLTSIGTTGCMGLAILNSEGFIGTCEGDVPTMLSMAVAQAVTGKASFQVNLSKAIEDELLFAHCTVPLNIVKDYCYDTHFESGIGVAVHGEFEPGAMTVVKIGSELEKFIVEDAVLEENQYGNNLCRTQVLIKAGDLKDYLLNEPLGNHHVLIPGHHAEEIKKAIGA